MKKSILGGIAFFLALSFIHAQGVDKKFQTQFTSYKVDNSTCVKIDHPSGSKIYIQDNAFDAQSESIEIQYREFITPVDMLVNNIPMTTTENGVTYQLESGGMFEIKALQNGKEVQLKKGKKIEVQLAREKGVDKMDKMQAFKMPSSFDGWNTVPNKVNNLSIGDNDDLWGSSSLAIDDDFIEDEFVDEEWGWGDWGAQNIEEFRRQDSIKNLAFQTMEIDQMGFYNYDYKLTDVNFIPIAANFNVNQKPTKNVIYVVYDDINTVFYYPPYTWAKDFKLISGKSYRMFSLDKEGKIAQLQIQPSLVSIANKRHTFDLEMESKVPESRDEIASILKL